MDKTFGTYNTVKLFQDHRQRLAQITALWVASGLIPPNILPITINEHQVCIYVWICTVLH